MIELLTVLSITILAVISPGPDFAMVSRNSMIVSRKAGLLTAIGISVGVLVHVTYALLGIGYIISQSIVAFSILKTIGALYLICLGFTMLRTKKPSSVQDNAVVPLEAFSALRQGFLTNVTNPKTTIFIVSVFSQVVSHETPMLIRIGYGLFMSFAHLAWFSLVAFGFSTKVTIEKMVHLKLYFERIIGGLLVAMGVGLVLSTNK